MRREREHVCDHATEHEALGQLAQCVDDPVTQAPRRATSRAKANHRGAASAYRCARTTGSSPSRSGKSLPTIAASQISLVRTRWRITQARPRRDPAPGRHRRRAGLSRSAQRSSSGNVARAVGGRRPPRPVPVAWLGSRRLRSMPGTGQASRPSTGTAGKRDLEDGSALLAGEFQPPHSQAREVPRRPPRRIRVEPMCTLSVPIRGAAVIAQDATRAANHRRQRPMDRHLHRSTWHPRRPGLSMLRTGLVRPCPYGFPRSSTEVRFPRD